MPVSTRTTRTTRQCLCPLVQLVRLDNACVHSYNPYDSTTNCLGPCLPNEMHFFTRQNSLSIRQCLCPLVQPVRLDNACVHSNDSYDSYDSTTDCLGPCLPNEMHFSTRQHSLSTRQCLCPLVQPVRLDNACVHSYDLYDSTKDSYVPYFGRHA